LKDLSSRYQRQLTTTQLSALKDLPLPQVAKSFTNLKLPKLLFYCTTIGFLMPTSISARLAKSGGFTLWLPLSLISSLLVSKSSTISTTSHERPPSSAKIHSAFALVSIASIFASTVAQIFLRPNVDVATCLLATYIGGAVNFFALSSLYRIPSETVSMLFAIDCGIMIMYLAAMEWAYGVFVGKGRTGPGVKYNDFNDEDNQDSVKTIRPLAIVAPLTILGLSTAIPRVSILWFPRLPPVVRSQSFIFSLVGLCTLPFFRLKNEDVPTMKFCARAFSKLFYAAVALSLGATRSLGFSKIQRPLALVAALQLIHTAIVFFIVRVTKDKNDRTAILLASNAAIGGSGTAGLYALNIGRPDLITKGVGVGVTGYLIGGFLAVLWKSSMMQIKMLS